MAQDFIDLKNDADIKAMIAEKERELKSAKEKVQEASDKIDTLQKTLKFLRHKVKSNDALNWKDLVGKWWRDIEDCKTNAQSFTYVIADLGYRAFDDGDTYRQLKVFDIDIDAWSPTNSIWLHESRILLCQDISSFSPVTDEEIQKYIVHFFTKIFDRLKDRDMLPDLYKNLVSSKQGVLCEPHKNPPKNFKKR